MSQEERNLVEIEQAVEVLKAIASHIVEHGSVEESARAAERVKSYDLALYLLRRPATDGTRRTVAAP
jgi:hypothetical protein